MQPLLYWRDILNGKKSYSLSILCLLTGPVSVTLVAQRNTYFALSMRVTAGSRWNNSHNLVHKYVKAGRSHKKVTGISHE